MRKCFECGAPAEEEHHVVPESRQGTKTVPLCASCHGKIHGVERASISALTRVALKCMRENGFHTGGRPPYGYKKEGEHLVPCEEERIRSKIIKGLRAHGMTYRAIVAHLENAGIPPRGSKWHPKVIMDICNRTEPA